MHPRRAHWIERLFPAGIVVYELDDSHPAPPLPAEEAAFVTQAVEKRRAEFSRGRSCARAACAAQGVTGETIPVGERRAPIWPASLVGSITHCRGLVAAAVGDRTQFRGVGLDAEPFETLSPELTARVASIAEREAAEDSVPVPSGVRGRLIFSAKEVVYKCVYPLTGADLDFEDVVIRFEGGQSSFRVEAVTALAQGIPEIAAIEGRYAITPDHLVVTGVLPVPS